MTQFVRLSNCRTVEYNALTGGSTGQIAAQYTFSGSFPSYTVRWYHYDRLGNVMNQTDGNANVVASYDQDAYGNTISNITTGQWASSISGRHLTTKEADADAGLYYFYQRWYEPQIGRFISRDPVFRDFHKLQVLRVTQNNPDVEAYRVIRQYLNQYAYSLNNPVNFVDFKGGCGDDPPPPSGPTPEERERFRRLIKNVTDFCNTNRENLSGTEQKDCCMALGELAKAWYEGIPRGVEAANSCREQCICDDTEGGKTGKNLYEDFNKCMVKQLPIPIQ